MPCSVGADLVLGTLGGVSCSGALERLALDALGASPTMPYHLRVRLNDPYHGGEVVRRCGRPELGWHALQLEVSRALYMDERTLTLYRPEAAAAVTATAANEPPDPAPAPTSTAPTPSVRALRDFAELRRRVSCLIRRLAWESEDACRSGTSTLHARVTDGDRA
jgi:hypothetical protein